MKRLAVVLFLLLSLTASPAHAQGVPQRDPQAEQIAYLTELATGLVKMLHEACVPTCQEHEILAHVQSPEMCNPFRGCASNGRAGVFIQPDRCHLVNASPRLEYNGYTITNGGELLLCSSGYLYPESGPIYVGPPDTGFVRQPSKYHPIFSDFRPPQPLVLFASQKEIGFVRPAVAAALDQGESSYFEAGEIWFDAWIPADMAIVAGGTIRVPGILAPDSRLLMLSNTQVNIYIADGFISVIPRESAEREFCMRLAQVRTLYKIRQLHTSTTLPDCSSQ